MGNPLVCLVLCGMALPLLSRYFASPLLTGTRRCLRLAGMTSGKGGKHCVERPTGGNGEGFSRTCRGQGKVGMLRRHRGWWIALGIMATLALVLVMASFFAEEPLRRYAEGQANDRLVDYRTTIGGLDLHPLLLAVDLHDVVVRQQAHPEPPLAVIPHTRAGVGLWSLLSGTIAAELSIDRPALSATREQVDEAFHKHDHQEVKEEAAAWQDALRDMMPLRVALSITNADITYEGPPAAERMYIQGLEIIAKNVTNRPDPDQAYPAELHLKAMFLEQAQLLIDGRADPLAKPFPAVDADLQVRDVDIPTVLKTMGRAELPVKEGVVEVTGHVEYAPTKQTVTIDDVTVKKPVIEYVGGKPSGEQAAQTREAAAVVATAVVPSWQTRMTELFPIIIHRAAVQEGQVTYRPHPGAEAFRISRLDVAVSEIRNQASKAGELPSELRVSARLPQDAEMTLEGKADLLAKPLPAVDATMNVQQLHLNSLLPVAEPFHLYLSQGVLDLKSRVQHSRDKTVVAVQHFLLDGAKLDYVYRAPAKEKEAAKKGASDAKDAYQNPSIVLKVDRGKILHSEVGFVNKSASPDYRVFMADMNVDVENLSNRVSEGTGVVKVTGKFMGSGPTVVTGTFRPEKPTPDFDLDVRIIKTKLTSLNNVFRAHGNLDMHEGMFAFFSNIKVKDGKVDGYVRPFLKDVDVYDPAQDRHKSKLNKAYQAIVGGVATVLKNEPRNEVATETGVSGPVENPRASTWQVVGNLVQNAFFEAITPGMRG